MTSKDYTKVSTSDEVGNGDDQPPTPETLSQPQEIPTDPGDGVDLNRNVGEEEKGEAMESTKIKLEDCDDGSGEGNGGEDDLKTDPEDSRWSCSRCYKWLMSNAVLLYMSQALSAWGDRMWSFAVALYLVEMDEALRLTAIYGLSVAGSSLIFGAAVGKWVDKTPRLRAARTSLVIQNTLVLVNASLLCTVIVFQSDIEPMWDGALFVVCQATIIILGTVASLASLAEKICIQRDWVVVVSGNDKNVLAKLNANMRRIDLIVNIVAPIAVGAILSVSLLVGGIFIAVWNAISMAVEYWNLYRVYSNVPALAIKGGVEFTDKSLKARDAEKNGEVSEPALASENGTPNEDKEFTEVAGSEAQRASTSEQGEASQSETGSGGCWGRTTAKLKEMFIGWKVYRSYEESWAGMGLAFLYMTVMGFDSITVGYGYTQGVPGWVVAMLQGLGSLTGILGTILFPFMRKRIGIERSGLYSLTIQISFLMLCLASVWVPGSPFIYDYDANTTMAEDSYAGVTGDWFETSTDLDTTPRPEDDDNICKYTGTEEQQTSFVSIALFYSGVILSRIGLWSFDLVATQLCQEHVAETERGMFYGVQRAMESSFDLIHFVLVIILPCPETFGYLIILSLAFVIMGAMCYMVYSYKKRGHLVHMDRLAPCMVHADAHRPPPTPEEEV